MPNPNGSEYAFVGDSAEWVVEVLGGEAGQLGSSGSLAKFTTVTFDFAVGCSTSPETLSNPIEQLFADAGNPINGVTLDIEDPSTLEFLTNSSAGNFTVTIGPTKYL